MNKRHFYIKVLGLFVISGIAKAGISAVSTVASAPNTVVNNHDHYNTYTEAPAVKSEDSA
jgi:hypothetical protein